MTTPKTRGGKKKITGGRKYKAKVCSQADLIIATDAASTTYSRSNATARTSPGRRPRTVAEAEAAAL